MGNCKSMTSKRDESPVPRNIGIKNPLGWNGTRERILQKRRSSRNERRLTRKKLMWIQKGAEETPPSAKAEGGVFAFLVVWSRVERDNFFGGCYEYSLRS